MRTVIANVTSFIGRWKRRFILGRIAVVIVSLALATVLAPLASTPAMSQSGGDYDLSWSSIDGGGTIRAAGGSYNLGGTIGQPDAGLVSGGVYSVGGGFWRGGKLVMEHTVYLPLVVRN